MRKADIMLEMPKPLRTLFRPLSGQCRYLIGTGAGGPDGGVDQGCGDVGVVTRRGTQPRYSQSLFLSI